MRRGWRPPLPNKTARHRKRYCKYGHDTEKHGRTPDGHCKICRPKHPSRKNWGPEPPGAFLTTLRKAREDLGMSREQFAWAVGCSPETIRMLEGCHQKASFEMQTKIKAVLVHAWRAARGDVA